MFIRNPSKPVVVPKILHHVWLDEQLPIENYANAWRRCLRSPWTYRSWGILDLHADAFIPYPGCHGSKHNWIELFDSETNPELKCLIASMAILEKYGGFVVHGFSIPLKSIPDELLQSAFMVAFQDEENFGTKLCYRAMASATHSDLIGDIYRTIQSNENPSEPINSMILSHPEAMVYPSYYFNPTAHGLPKELLKSSVCIHLSKIERNLEMIAQPNVPTLEPCPIQPSQPTSIEKIMIQLNENPIDRLGQFNKPTFDQRLRNLHTKPTKPIDTKLISQQTISTNMKLSQQNV